MKKFITLIALLCVAVGTRAQQDPQFTQYTYNMSVINPAYATTDFGMLNLGGIYRKQWADAVGGPKTFSFFAHTPFSTKIEMGLSVTSDDIANGTIKEANTNADFAYILPLDADKKHQVSLGLKAGFTSFNSNFSGFRLPDTVADDDPAFRNNISQVFPTIGVGAYYFTSTYYLGISTPNFIKSEYLNFDVQNADLGNEEIHMYAVGGYVHEFTNNFKLKPSFMVRSVKGAPINLDLSVNTLLYDRLELGASYRFDDSVSGIVGFQVLPSLKIGYSYDATISDFSSYNNGSHEVILLFDVDLLGLKDGYKKSPRFF